MSRSELILLLVVLVVVAFLFWTRNVIVRVPGIPTPISSGALVDPGEAVIVDPVTGAGAPRSGRPTPSGSPLRVSKLPLSEGQGTVTGTEVASSQARTGGVEFRRPTTNREC